MKTISLSKGRYAMVDDIDYGRVSQHTWHAAENRNCWYAQRMSSVNGKRKIQKMHSFILDTIECVDHKDLNGLNNCRDNLRLATASQNAANKRRNSNSKQSIYKGVHNVGKDRNLAKPWQAQIMKSGKSYSLGYYKTQEEAALAYNIKAKELFEDFALLNVLITPL